MASELEAVALRLFEERGFGEVTVEEIASEAHISVRTFYRYFPTKEDVLQLQIDRRSDALRAALSARPADEATAALAPPRAGGSRVRGGHGAASTLDRRDRGHSRVCCGACSAGIQLKGHRVIAEFFGARLGMPSDSLVPTMLAAAAGGVIQAAQTHWYYPRWGLGDGRSPKASTYSRAVSAPIRRPGPRAQAEAVSATRVSPPRPAAVRRPPPRAQ